MARILIVEDDPAVRQTVELIVRRANLGEVDSAKDGERGWEKIRTGNYAVAVVDLYLPGRSGIDLIKMVSTNHLHIDIAVVSGIATHADALDAGLSGATAYFEKPIEIKRMLAWIEDCLRDRTRHPHQLAQQIDDHLRDQCTISSLSINQIADSVGVTPNYVSKLLKQHVGRNFTNRLKEYRVERAKELLTTTKDPIYTRRRRMRVQELEPTMRRVSTACRTVAEELSPELVGRRE